MPACRASADGNTKTQATISFLFLVDFKEWSQRLSLAFANLRCNLALNPNITKSKNPEIDSHS